MSEPQHTPDVADNVDPNTHADQKEGGGGGEVADGTEVGHGGAHAIDAKHHHHQDGATAADEDAGVLKLADEEGAEEGAAPVVVGKDDEEEGVEVAVSAEPRTEDEHTATHEPLSFKADANAETADADADLIAAKPVANEDEDLLEELKKKKKAEEENAHKEGEETSVEPATTVADESVLDASHHADDIKQEDTEPAVEPATATTDAAPETADAAVTEPAQTEAKVEEDTALETTTTAADPPAPASEAEDVQVVDPETHKAHPLEAEPADEDASTVKEQQQKEDEVQAIPAPAEPVTPVVGEPVETLKEEADEEHVEPTHATEETAVPAHEEPTQDEEAAHSEPEPVPHAEEPSHVAAHEEPAAPSAEPEGNAAPEPVTENVSEEHAAPEEPAVEASTHEVASEEPTPEATHDAPAPEEQTTEPSLTVDAEDVVPPATATEEEPAPAAEAEQQDGAPSVPEPPVEVAHQPLETGDVEPHATVPEDAQPAVNIESEVEAEAPSTDVERSAHAEDAVPAEQPVVEEAPTADEPKLEETPVAEEPKPEEPLAAEPEETTVTEPEAVDLPATIEPASEWRDDVPTPVEVDEVVVAPQSLLATETLAAADLAAGKESEDLDQDVVEDVKAADLSEAAPAPAEEASTAPAQEEEEPISAHVAGPVASILATLEDVSTPAVDVAGTPDAVETDAPVVDTPLAVEEKDEEGQTQEALAQVLEAEPVVAEEPSSAAPIADIEAEEPVALEEEESKDTDAPSVSEPDTPSLSVAPSEDSEEPQTPVAVVAEDHAEAPQIKVDDEEEVAQPETAEEEKRPSRPWTPSYSVTNTGPNEQAEEPVVDEEEPTAPAIQRSASSTSLNAPATAEEPERPKSPWTPSYSVTQQGPGDAAELDALEPLPAPAAPAEGTTSEDTAPLSDKPEELAAAVEPVEDLTSDSTAPPLDDAVTAAEAQVPSGDVVTSEGNTSAPALSAPDAGAEIDRPKSPWTPSYSVTQQGPGEPAELDALEQLPEPLAPVEGTTSEDTAPTTDRPDVLVEETAATDEVTSDATGAPTDALAASDVPERPKSPWTPSYSVTNLQGGAAEEKDLEEEEVPTKSITPDIRVSGEAGDQAVPTAETAEPERPKSPWTPSYSVTNQGSGQDEKEISELEQLPPTESTLELQAPVPRVATPEIRVNDLPSESEEKVDQEERPKSPWTPSYSVTTLQGDVKPEENAEESTEAPAQAPAEEQPERPKSPWTPSYSVTNLKGGEQENKELENLEQLPAPVAVASTSSEEAVDRPKSPWTPSYSVTNLQGGAKEEKEIEQLEQLPEPVTAPAGVAVEEPVDRPKSPWTPSYSVTNLQGGAAEASELEQQEQQPASTDAATVPASIAVPQEELERPKSPWTPSYSVTNLQGGAPDTDSVQVSEVIAKDEPPQEVVSEDTAPAQLAPSIQVTDETLGSANEVAVEEPERPKSPWVSSYSVTDQPGSPRQAPKEIEPTSDIGTAEPERPKSPWTPSYSVTNVGAGPKEDAELDKLEQLPAPVAVPASQDNTAELTSDSNAAPNLQPSQSEEPERPKSPWTPSYSVTQQGSAQPSETRDKFEPLPSLSTSTPAPAQVATTDVLAFPAPAKYGNLRYFATIFPSILKMAFSPLTRAELSPLDVPGSPRSRRSSKSSSRFFPGGWFNTPKSPTTHDLPEADESEPSGPASATAENATAEKKSRPCLIM